MILYVTKNDVKDRKYHHSRQLDFAGVIIDYNENYEIIGVEILGAEEVQYYSDSGDETTIVLDDSTIREGKIDGEF